ncbi:MAG: M20 family peptidase [Candidatus Sericytochromatia bacterium]
MRLWMTWAAGLLLAVAVATLSVLGFNLARFQSRQPPSQAATVPDFADQGAVQRLAEALKLPTISAEMPARASAFDALHRLLARSYPTLYRSLKPERLGHSLLIHWPGTDPRPGSAVLLAAHLDVVPVEQPESWQQPAFAGKIADGYIWGRGSLDDKNSALALLEAIEAALKAGQRPQRSIYIALGEDEEVGGARGAQRMAALLKQRGVQLEAVLDEGLVIVPGSMIGLQPPVALNGIAEKGYLTLALRVEQAGGHSSMPPRDTAVDLLSRALTRLHDQPLPARLAGPAAGLFDWLGPEMPLARRLALANRALFGSLLLQQLDQSPATSALIRTTVAPTVLKGSPKDNVLAARAEAVINLRVLPGDSLALIQAHFKRVIADSRVQISVLSPPEMARASRVSRTDSAFFGTLSTSIRQIFPEALIAPSLVLAATDSRHYEGVARDIYRFQPVALTAEDLARLHGRDERISVTGYLNSIRFYQQLLAQL